MSARLRFAAVLGAPHVTRLLWTALLARAPTGINGLALVLFVRSQTGSYATAGLVAGAYAAGAAGVAPLLGRVVDRKGTSRVLMPLALAHGVFLALVVVLGLAGAPAASLVACAFLSGSAIPPLGSVLRALWPSLMGRRRDLLPAAYALDAVAIEITFVAGPLLVGIAAAYDSPELALAAAAGLVVVGTAAFAGQSPVRNYAPHESEQAGETGGRLGALRSPGVRTIVVTLVPMGFCFGAAEVAFPAFGEAEGNRALAGPLIAIWSAGSAAGGLVYGAHGHRIAVRDAYLRTLALVPFVTLPLALADSFAVMAPLALLAGVAIAPMIAAGGQLVGEIAPRGALTEAYTWPITSLVAGLAAGNAAAGGVVSALGWREAFVMAAAVAVCGIVIGLARRGTLVPASP